MKFRIDAAIFDKFPGLHVGAVIARGIDNSGTAEGLPGMIRAQEKEIVAKCNAEAVSQEPRIDAWRKAYSVFGGEPKKNRSSVENLYRMVLNGIELRGINKLVDCYNLVSLKHMLPLGGEDLDRMQGDVVLGFAGPSEAPALLLGDKEPHPPRNGEVIYKDGISTICRRWNWREADRTKLTENTRNAILVLEGLPPVTKAEIETATRELDELVRKYCGGSTVCAVLDEEKMEIEF
ncbi:B3/4 domain protein [uncultured archaeon]|nr:B3/4 domain protein [uncultured archaeon]